MLNSTRALPDNVEMRRNVAYPSRNSTIALTCMEYAYALQSKGVYPKTVFSVHTADDPVLHSSLTAVRVANLLMCQITADYNWQFISLPIEKELGNYFGKARLVKWAYENDIPLEKTRSCYKASKEHCGECFPACKNRKKAFADADIEDSTSYII